MKKALALILTICMVFSMLPVTAFAASVVDSGTCGDNLTWISYTAECDHSFESVVTDPTCKEEGYTTYTCTVCGYSYVDGYVDALGHHGFGPLEEKQVDATCETEGYYDNVMYCWYCLQEMGRERVAIPALGHDYWDGVCTRCGDCGDGIVSLELVSAPWMTSYAVGDTLNPDGIRVTGYFEDGEAIELTDKNLSVLSYDMSTVGVSTAYVGIGEVSVSFPVYVHVSSVNVELDPATYPESDHNYADNADDWQTLSYPGAASLTLEFSFETYVQTYNDHIYVYDGNDNLIAQYTGLQAGSTLLTVPGDTVKINLRSDDSYSHYGYSFTRITARVFLEHTNESADFRAPTCTEPGYAGAIDCEICGEHVDEYEIPAQGHTFTGWGYNDDNELIRTCINCGLEEKLEIDRLFTVAGESSNPDLSMEQIHELYALVDWDMTTSYVTQPSLSAPYAAGRLTDDCLDNLVAQVNFFRAIARLDNVGWAEDYVTLAQHAAVVNAANKEVDPYPSKPADMDDDFYNLAYQGAESSHLSHRSPSPLSPFDLGDLVQEYLGWVYLYNIVIPNPGRYCVLNPFMADTGFGSAAWYHAMYQDDEGNSDAEFDFVAYPGGSSVFPNEFFNGLDFWSTHLSGDTFEISSLDALRVTLIRESDGREWIFDANTTGTGDYFFGLNYVGYDGTAIVFCPDGVDSYQGAYTVRITGLWTKSGESAAIEYTVNFQSIENQGCDHVPAIRGAYDATCEEDGYTGDTYCSVCGELIETGQVIPATGHYYKGTVTNPTCQEQGYTTHTCAICGDSYVGDYTDPVDHIYEDGECIWCGGEEPEEPAVLLGDVDGNGVINTFDALMTLKYYTGEITAAAVNLDAADVDGNGIINTFDALQILKYYTGEITRFPAEK